MTFIRKLLTPWSMGFLAATGVSAAFGRWEFVALALLGFLGSAAWSGLRVQTAPASRSVLDQVSNNNRVRLRPLSQLSKEIDAIIATNRNNSVVATMGAEIQNEALAMLTHCVGLLQIRDKLADVSNSKAALDATRSQADDVFSESIRKSLAQAETKTQQIDGYLEQAQAVLSEMRTRLAAAATSGQELAEEGMREALLNSRALSATFDEAEAFLKGEA